MTDVLDTRTTGGAPVPGGRAGGSAPAPPRTSWLTAQLPQALRTEPVLTAFTEAGGRIADTIRFQVASLDAQLDPDTASPPMLAFVAGWLGFALDPRDDPAVLRRVLRRLGMIMRTRGTAASLAELLGALSGGTATVSDPGGVAGPGQQLPPAGTVVRVVLDRPGPLGLDRLRQIAERELPIGVSLELSAREGAA